MKKFLLLSVGIVCLFCAQAQTAGDYRSIATGDWSSLSTWERFDGVSWQAAVVAPAYTDATITIRTPNVVTVTAAITVDELTVDPGGTLTLNSSVSVSNGTATDITVNGVLQVGAALSGAGNTEINGVMNWTTGTVTSPVTIFPAGTLNISGAGAKAINGTLTNNGTVNWNAGNIDFNNGTLVNNGAFKNAFDGVLTQTSGTNNFTNNGTFTKTAGTGTTTIAIIMTNSGTLQVNTGVVNKITNQLTNSGPVDASSGAEFRITAPATLLLNTGSSFTGNGTVTLASPVTNNLALNIPASLLLVQAGGSDIAGTGSFSISGVMSWTGGKMGNACSILTGAVLNISTVTTKQLLNTITNDGTINWLGGAVNFINGGINNNTTIDIKIDANMSNFGGTNFIVNTGTIQKTAGTSTTSIIIPLTNTGNIIVNSGTLISAGVLNLNTGSVISGTGTLGIDGTVNVNIPVSAPSSLTIRKSVGTTSGTQTFTINGVMNWLGGTLASPFTIVSGATLSMSGGPRSLNSTLTNNGVTNWTGGAIDFNNGTFINNGSITNSFDGNMNSASGSNLFNNTGTFSKIAGTLTNTTIAVPALNSGTINVNATTLVNSGNSFTNTGLINIGAGKTFANIGTLMLQPGTSVTGTGVLALAGVTQFTTNLTIPTGMTLSASTGCTTFGAGTCTVNSIMNWNGGTLGSPFVLPASATLNAAAAAKSLNSVLTNNGNFLWTAGDISFNNGTLINNGTMDQSFNGMMDVFSGTNAFTNAGTFTKSAGTGISAINIPSSNSGIIDGAGTISFNDSFSNTGTIKPGKPLGILTVSTALSPLLTSSSTLQIDIMDATGAGTGNDQLLLNNNLVLDGTLQVTDIGTTPAGVYTIVSLTAGTITGNFTAINVPAAYTVTISSTTITLNKSLLPVNWISFTGSKKENKISLNWNTDNERNNQSFEVERSDDGKVFEKIGTVAGKSVHESKVYSFDDLAFHAGTNYYRLKQIDLDGKYAYSKIVVVHADMNTDRVQIFPNPSNGAVNIILPAGFSGGDVFVRTVSGQLLKTYNKVNEHSLSLSLPNGTYLIQLKSRNNTVVQQVIIK